MLLAGAIAPLTLTVLLVLFLPESVKYLVHRGKSVAQVKRIAQRFMSGSLEQVTQFYLDEDKVTVKKGSVAQLFSMPRCRAR